MFKNSNLLKGVVFALAFVLVLACGVLLNTDAVAETNTVVLYVSDNGNNTTGKDAATAFTSFIKATEAANEMQLAPGTELKIIVPDKVLVTDRYLDKNTVKDTAGNKVHITITSADAGSPATILHHHYNSGGSTSYEKIILSNDITFKDIIISAQVQPYYQNNAPVVEPIDYGKLYRTRYIHVGSNTVEFDNCEITSTIPDQSKATSWTLLCDSYASSSVAGASHLRLLNGNYSNCTVYVQDQVTPYWDLSLYVENASVGTVYALADTDTGSSVNAKSVTCTFKDATVSSYNPMGRGNIAVTEGVTAIFEGETVVKNWVACMSNSSSTGNYRGDLRYYFRDDCSISATSTDSIGEAIIYLAPPVMTGDLHVNVEGGTFKSPFCTGTDKNKSLSTAPVLNGNIYNEFKGGTFKAGFYCGMGRAAGTINGSIYNNFYDGFYLEKGTSYLGSRLGVINGSIYNNWYGGELAKVEIYMGGGYGDSSIEKSVVKGDIITNIYDGIFAGTFWGGPRSQIVEGGIYTTYMGGQFKSTFVAGGLQVICPEVHNVFKNGPDGSHAVLSGTSYLGSRGGSVEGTYTFDRLYNTFEGDVEVKGYLYCADGTQSNVEVTELVQNDFKGGTFGSYVYCTTAKKHNILSAEVVNNFYDGVVFKSLLFGGGQHGGSGSITNNFYGGDFQKYVYGVSSETDKQSYDYIVNGDVTNNIYGGTFGSQLILGGMATCDGTLTNNIYGGIFEYFVYGNSNSGNYNQMDVVNNIHGGEFRAWFCGGSNTTQGGSITNNVYGGHFIGSHKEALHKEAGRMCFMGGDYGASATGEMVPVLTNNIYGGIFEERVYFGGRIANVKKIYTTIAGGTFNGDRICPSMYQLSCSQKVEENILSVKPDESEQPLIFACNYTPHKDNGSSVYASYGLENCIVNKYQDTLILYGAKKPIYICGETLLNFDEVKGAVTFIQLEDWVDGNVYLTAPTTEDLSGITFYNASIGLSGSAEIKEMKADLGIASDEQDVLCNVLVGTDSADAPAVAAIPELSAINFVLDNNLQVNFYVEKAVLEDYLAKAGTFTYQIICGDDVLTSGTISDMAQAEVIDTYVKIKSEFSVAAFGYGEYFTLDLAGNLESFTVYDLLKLGIENSADNAALADLLKAIYNYGVEAEKIQKGSASVSDSYSEITYTGTYTGRASAQSYASGYSFAGTSLSLGKEVSLNFFMKASSVEDLVFTASSSKGILDSSRIVVTPFAGNSQYNVVVSLRLDVASMDEVFTLKVQDTAGKDLAACSNSVAYCCANYIAANNDFAPISAALLAYVEKAQAI